MQSRSSTMNIPPARCQAEEGEKKNRCPKCPVFFKFMYYATLSEVSWEILQCVASHSICLFEALLKGISFLIEGVGASGTRIGWLLPHILPTDKGCECAILQHQLPQPFLAKQLHSQL